jgi:hypothetical protein
LTNQPLNSAELKEAAEQAWRKGFTAQEIKDFLQIPRTIRQISNWIQEWEKTEFNPSQTIFAADNRLRELVNKPDKSYLELREMQIVGDIVARLDNNTKSLEIAKVRKTKIDGGYRKNNEPRQRDENGEVIKHSKKTKNDISHITLEMFEKFEEEHLYWHQKLSVKAAFNTLLMMIRMLLKSRQAGQTFVEAYIAFKRGCLTGETHIFTSITKALALQFRVYICFIARNFFDCDEFIGGTGDSPMILYKDGKPHCMFYFVPPTVAGLQGKAGHLIMDECAYWTNFKRLSELAIGMTTQNYTVTFLTTPSSIKHPFYEYWNGEWFNKYKTKSERVFIEYSHAAFQKQGGYILGGDGIARLAYSIHDLHKHDKRFAEKTPMDSLHKKYPNPRVFKNILELQWINDLDSIFDITQLLACAVPDEKWKAYERSKGVAAVYDPSGSTTKADQAGLGWTELPDNEKDVFRFLKYRKFRGEHTDIHLDEFRDSMQDFNLTHAFVDGTVGGVYMLPQVEKIFPTVENVTFSVAVKTQMVHKMEELIRKKRWLYPESMKDEVTSSFLSVKKGMTERSGQASYYWERDSDGNHGELFVTAAIPPVYLEGMVAEAGYQDNIGFFAI